MRNTQLLYSNLISAGYTGNVNSALYKYLWSQGYSFQLNDMLFKYLGDRGYTGSLSERLRQWDEDGMSLVGGTPPVLSNFVDNLDQDPPTALFDSDQVGTLVWDFHSSATPPASGAGDIGTGMDSVAVGANQIQVDLTAYSLQTGYLHFRVANANGTSNILTSQQITVPKPWTVEAGNLVNSPETFTNSGDWGPLFCVVTEDVNFRDKMTSTQNGIFQVGQANIPHTNRTTFKVVAERGNVDYLYLNISGIMGADLETNLNTGATLVQGSAGGTIENLTATDLGGGLWQTTFDCVDPGTGVITLKIRAARASGSIGADCLTGDYVYLACATAVPA